MSACPHVVTSGEGTSFCSLAAAGPPAVLYCPACGVNRLPNEEDPRTDPVDEWAYRCPAVKYVDELDHWPGTGMGLACPRCGTEAAPVTADGFVDRYARQWRPRPRPAGSFNANTPYALTTVTAFEDLVTGSATEATDA